jgi:hypothetical protein
MMRVLRIEHVLVRDEVRVAGRHHLNRVRVIRVDTAELDKRTTRKGKRRAPDDVSQESAKKRR